VTHQNRFDTLKQDADLDAGFAIYWRLVDITDDDSSPPKILDEGVAAWAALEYPEEHRELTALYEAANERVLPRIKVKP